MAGHHSTEDRAGGAGVSRPPTAAEGLGLTSGTTWSGTKGLQKNQEEGRPEFPASVTLTRLPPMCPQPEGSSQASTRATVGVKLLTPQVRP